MERRCREAADRHLGRYSRRSGQPRERPPIPTQAALLARIEPKAARAIQPRGRGHTRLKQRKKVTNDYCF